MRIRQRINRILLLWLLIALGAAGSTARSFASCDMGSAPMAASNHACCVRKSVCTCTTQSSSGLKRHTRALPEICGTGCPCVAPPQPVSSIPVVEPLRLYVVAALPTRAGPIPTIEISTLAVTAPLPAAAFPRFVPPSPPRAPPF